MGRLAGTKATPLHPYRVALAGGWGDHNFVNFLADGYVVVVQIQPTVAFHDRCGICSSTRQILMKKYPRGKPDHIDKYQLATELYYWENVRKVPIGGSQDAWGSVYPGISLLHYDFRHHNGVLPMAVSSLVDERAPGGSNGTSGLWIASGRVPMATIRSMVGGLPRGRLSSNWENPGRTALPPSRTETWNRSELRSTCAPPPGEKCCPPFSNIRPSKCP